MNLILFIRKKSNCPQNNITQLKQISMIIKEKSSIFLQGDVKMTGRTSKKSRKQCSQLGWKRCTCDWYRHFKIATFDVHCRLSLSAA